MKKNKKKNKAVPVEVVPQEEIPVQADETLSEEEPILAETETAEKIAAPAEDTPAVTEEEELISEPETEEETAAETDPPASPRAYPAPFVRTSERIHSLMMDVIIALLPAFLWGVYTFGTRVLTVAVVSVASCVLFEALLQLIRRRPVTIFDLSAVVTGVLLTMGFSSAVPIWRARAASSCSA